MGVQIDLIIPPIIVGLLVILIFNVNAFILETSVDNRLTNDMQTFADVSVDIIQEELRGLVEVHEAELIPVEVEVEGEMEVVANTYSNFKFTLRQGNQEDEVTIWAEDGILKIKKFGDMTSPEETSVYPGYLKDVHFEYHPISNPSFLRVKVITESKPEHHARFGKNDDVVRAFAEIQVYLRNLDL